MPDDVKRPKPGTRFAVVTEFASGASHFFAAGTIVAVTEDELPAHTGTGAFVAKSAAGLDQVLTLNDVVPVC